MLNPERQPQPQGSVTLLGAAAVMLLALAVPSSSAAAVSRLEISQARQLDDAAAKIRLYLDVDDAGGGAVTDLRAHQIAATLGEAPLAVENLRPFDPDGDGIAYVFLIDISKSLSDREFELILEALDVWVLSLGPRDRVAVIAFGDESRLVVDFTSDATRIQAGLYSLGPSDSQTMLHEALRDGLELCSRRDPDLPGRRVLMVLTDGRDEGSGLTADDVLDLLRSDPVPLYAIGLSRIRDPGERRRHLDQLNRLAANSGGAFFEGSTATLGTAYESIRRAIRDVWTADLTCGSCPLDGEARRLQLLLSDDGRILSAGRHVRLLPTNVAVPAATGGARSTPSAAEGELESGTDASRAEAAGDGQEKGIDARSGPAANWPWFVLVVAVVVGAAAWTLWRRRRVAAQGPGPATTGTAATAEPRRTVEPAPRDDARPEEDATPAEPPAGPDSGSVPIPVPYRSSTGIETTRPPRPAIMRLVRMIVVRGSKPGRQYALTLFQKAIAGSRSTCDCVLVDPGVEPEQFEISQRDGRVYLRNLASSNPTLVDGVPLAESHPLKSGSLVGNRDFIVRLVYEDARPINT